jgi:hypothetical protein
MRGPGGLQVPVPRHREIKRGTARTIKQARTDWRAFEQEIS